jgi:hypothetical protein
MESFLLRLVGTELTEGRVAGTLEVVETGEVIKLGSADQLLEILVVAGHPAEPNRAERGGILEDR